MITKIYKTEQENFWVSDFGLSYMERNNTKELIASKIYLFSKMLNKMNGVKKVLELGANIGLNLEAINILLPHAKLSAVEINELAAEKLKLKNIQEVFVESIIDFNPIDKYDLVFTMGVLIHINPNELENVYKTIYASSEKYICIAEYYNSKPIAIDYRGHQNKLFKRDFCGDLMNIYPDLKLVDYGFVYHRDNNFPSDDFTWFVLEKI